MQVVQHQQQRRVRRARQQGRAQGCKSPFTQARCTQRLHRRMLAEVHADELADELSEVRRLQRGL